MLARWFMRRQVLHPRTAALNQKQKIASKQSRLSVLRWLASEFPYAFDNSVKIRPLKIGIINDILDYSEKASAAGISKAKLREAVVVFTRRIDYLSCLKAKEMRVDLHGQPVARVTEEEAENAALKIKKRVEKSIRNARKLLTNKALPQIRPLNERGNAYTDNQRITEGASNPHANSAKAPLIRHKTIRSFDPDTVARLKEKLGLSRASVPETIE